MGRLRGAEQGLLWFADKIMHAATLIPQGLQDFLQLLRQEVLTIGAFPSD